jgi:hypothetical protein
MAFLRPEASQGLCVDCHGFETLWRFLYYHKEQRNPYPERNLTAPSQAGGTEESVNSQIR